MNCRDVERNAVAWLQGRRPELGEALERHVAGCARCARLLETERALVRGLRALKDDAPAPDLWAGVYERIRDVAPSRAPVRRGWLAFAGTAAVAAGLAFVSLKPKQPARDLVLAPEDEGRIVRMAADILPPVDPAEDLAYEGMRATRHARQVILIGYAGDGE